MCKRSADDTKGTAHILIGHAAWHDGTLKPWMEIFESEARKSTFLANSDGGENLCRTLCQNPRSLRMEAHMRAGAAACAIEIR
jgi:hypothetical protein